MMRAWPSQALAGRFQTTPLANVQVRWSLEIVAVGQPFEVAVDFSERQSEHEPKYFAIAIAKRGPVFGAVLCAVLAAPALPSSSPK